MRTVLSDLLSQALVLVQHGHVEAAAREGVLGGGKSRVLAQHLLHLALAGQPDSAVQPLPLVLGTDMNRNKHNYPEPSAELSQHEYVCNYKTELKLLLAELFCSLCASGIIIGITIPIETLIARKVIQNTRGPLRARP